jgi:hypothetical protein
MNMNTDDLINILAHAPQPDRPMRPGLLALIVMGISALATILLLGLRPELIALQPPGSFWIKTALLAAMAGVSCRALENAARPASARQRYWLEILLTVIAALLVIGEWATTDHSKILSGFLIVNFPSCLICVTLYGGLGMAGFTALMRRYAPVDLDRCAGLIGLAAASAAAVGYSIHCPLDSPTFIVVAYGLPMAALWYVGRAILPRQLGW